MRLTSFSAPTGVLVVLGAIVHANAGNTGATRSVVEAELIAAQQSQIMANNAADIAALDRLTAEEWTGVKASGELRSKAQFLEDVARRGPSKVRATSQQLFARQQEWHVKTYDNVGIVTRLSAGDHGSRVWNTGVWVKRNGRWLRVFSQETTSAPK